METANMFDDSKLLTLWTVIKLLCRQFILNPLAVGTVCSQEVESFAAPREKIESIEINGRDKTFINRNFPKNLPL